jgi:TPR repeat protein
MKKLLLCAVLCISIPAFADELANADAQFARGAFPEAMRLYTRLGNAGNPAAQLRLGEMYLSGAAGQVDEGKAVEWLAKSAAKGNTSATVALKRLKRRSEIDYWVTNYDGADIRADLPGCAAPRVPAISKQNDEIERIEAKINTWQDCYNRYVTELNGVKSTGKRTPAEIAALLTPAESAQAEKRFGNVLENLQEEANVNAKLTLADIAAWRTATNAYVAEHNAIVQSGPSAERSREIEARRRNYAQPAK